MTARNTDPTTSHVAAIGLLPKLPNLRAIYVAGLEALGEATAGEIAAWVEANGGTRTQAESVRKRKKEITDSGLAKVVGIRQCSVTRNNCEVLMLCQAVSVEKKRSVSKELEDAAVAFVRSSGWIEPWRVPVEVMPAARFGGNWPTASMDEWILAVEAGVSSGRLEEKNGKVRITPPAAKPVQRGLFDD